MLDAIIKTVGLLAGTFLAIWVIGSLAAIFDPKRPKDDRP